MNEYAKALAPLIGGIVLLVVGALLGDKTLLHVGAAMVGVSPVVYAVPNRP